MQSFWNIAIWNQSGILLENLILFERRELQAVAEVAANTKKIMLREVRGQDIISTPTKGEQERYIYIYARINVTLHEMNIAFYIEQGKTDLFELK